MWNLILRVKPKLIRGFLDSNKPYLLLAQLRNLGNQSPKNSQNVKLKSTLFYAAAGAVFTVGLSYAAVPLYRMFCAAYSYGGKLKT